MIILLYLHFDPEFNNYFENALPLNELRGTFFDDAQKNNFFSCLKLLQQHILGKKLFRIVYREIKKHKYSSNLWFSVTHFMAQHFNQNLRVKRLRVYESVTTAMLICLSQRRMALYT